MMGNWSSSAWDTERRAGEREAGLSAVGRSWALNAFYRPARREAGSLIEGGKATAAFDGDGCGRGSGIGWKGGDGVRSVLRAKRRRQA
jgi:hypothetical protein